VVEQLKTVLPEELTVARYEDGGGKDWNVAVCDFGSTQRTWTTWLFAQVLLQGSGLQPVQVSGARGMGGATGDEQVLIFHKGPYLVILAAPSSAPQERLVALGDSLQL
jgi:hypothetical protein